DRSAEKRSPGHPEPPGPGSGVVAPTPRQTYCCLLDAGNGLAVAARAALLQLLRCKVGASGAGSGAEGPVSGGWSLRPPGGSAGMSWTSITTLISSNTWTSRM